MLQATGKRKLLDVLSRFADHISTRPSAPSKASCAVTRATPRLSWRWSSYIARPARGVTWIWPKYFIDERGQAPHYLILKRTKIAANPPKNYWARTYRYTQAHAPLREQTEANGHSVRACYLYAGVADVALETGR